MEKKEKTRRIEDLDFDGVVEVLEKWDLHEFVEFVKEKQIDGRKLLGVTEGIVKLWRPRVNAKKFIEFITKLKAEPEKHLNFINDDIETEVKANIEAQYQTVNVKKIREQLVTTSVGVEEILKKIVPAKSFLYRNQPAKSDKPITSYTPMAAGGTKKPKKFFRLSSYEYPHFDVKNFRFSRQENFNDQGYYSIKTNNTYYMQKIYKNPDLKTKHKSLSPTEEAEMFPEEHFYEDLNYNEVDKTQSHTIEFKPHVNVKPCMVKIQELFSSFKLPFFKKPEEVEGEKKLEDVKSDVSEKDGHIYENSDSVASVYDSIHVSSQGEGDAEKQEGLPVEEYLEPVHLSKDYCDVAQKQKDDSILGYILSIFENFGMRRDTTDSTPNEEPEKVQDEKPDEKPRSNMADRPLPIPVENEPYYMNIDRTEAENLLRGQPDGTFVLRPSSQPNHAYTLTVACSNEVHNVGIRRRPDGRLALGFARRGERSFSSVTSLLRHHKKRRLLLVAGGGICGATTLNDTPQYYQTPSSLPFSA